MKMNCYQSIKGQVALYIYCIHLVFSIFMTQINSGTNQNNRQKVNF